MVKRSAAIILIIFFICSGILFSEKILNKNRMYLYFDGSSIGENDSTFFKEVLVENIETIEKLSLIDSGQEKIPDKDDKKSNTAKKAGADLWLYLNLQKIENNIEIKTKLFDLLNKKVIFEKQYQSAGSLKRIENIFWKDLIDDLEENLSGLKTVTTFGTSFLELKAEPGTIIKGLSEEEVEINESGRAVFPVEGNRSYRVIAKKKGYKGIRESIYAESGNSEFKLEQEALHKYSYSLGMQNGNPTAFINYFIVPESVYVGTGLTYSGTYIWPEFFDVNESDWMANTLSFHAELGKILGSDYKKLQLFNSVRLLFNYMIPSDELNQSPQVHPLFPFGVSLIQGFKVNTGKNSSINLVFMPTFYPKIKSKDEAELLAAEWEAKADTDLESYPYDGQYQDMGAVVFGMNGSIVFTRTF